MNNFYKKLNQYIYFFSGIIIIYLLFVNRLFPKLPKEIIYSAENFPIELYIILVIMYLFSILISIKNLLNETNTDSKNSFIIMIQYYIIIFFTEINIACFYVYYVISNYIPNFKNFLYKISIIFIKLTKFRLNFLFLFCQIFPRVCILFGFIFDIYLSKFHYFYIALITLILPLIFKSILFILYAFAKENIDELDKFLSYDLKIFSNNIDEQIIIKYKIDITIPQPQMKEYANRHYTCIKLRRILNTFYNSNIHKYIPWIILIYLLLLFFCWRYICLKYFNFI